MAGDEPKKGVTDDASSSQQRKLISPFDITTLDNPGLVITQVQLKGDNYDEWSRSFRTAIRARKKFGFFDGTIERLGEKDKDIEDWWTIIQEERVNTMGRVKDERPELMALAMQNRTEAKNRSNGGKIDHVLIQKGMVLEEDCRLDAGKVEAVEGSASAILELFLQRNKKKKNVTKTFPHEPREVLRNRKRSNILAQDPLPNLNKVYSILIQEERVNTMVRGKDERPELMALAMQNRTEAKNRSTTFGYKKELVWKWIVRLYAGKVEASGTNRAQYHAKRSTSANNGIKDADSIPLAGLIEKLTNIKEIVEWPVELPDGHVVMANKEGNILFNNGTQFWRRDCAGKRWDGGLFYFREKPLVQALNTTLSISVDLWHKRLGHPPLEVINFLPGVSSSRKDKVISENCEMLTTLSLMFTMMRHIMEPLHKKGGDPSRTSEGSKFVPQDNVSSSSQSLVKETIESPHEEELGRGCHKKESLVRLRDFVTHTIRKASPFPSS
ncbi:retrovirus-related pol polyprotein from transposon TNT 1-94 [Tanacetum coccineum]